MYYFIILFNVNENIFCFILKFFFSFYVLVLICSLFSKSPCGTDWAMRNYKIPKIGESKQKYTKTH